MVQTLIVYGAVALAAARIVWTSGLRKGLTRRHAPRAKTRDCGPDCNCSG